MWDVGVKVMFCTFIFIDTGATIDFGVFLVSG